MDLYCRSSHSTSANHGPSWVQIPPINKCCRSSHSLPSKHSTNCGFITNHGSALLSKHSTNHGFYGSALPLKQRKSWICITVETVLTMDPLQTMDSLQIMDPHCYWNIAQTMDSLQVMDPHCRRNTWIRCKPWIHYKSWIRICRQNTA